MDSAGTSIGTEEVTFDDMRAVTENVGRKISFINGLKSAIFSILIGLGFVAVGIFQIVVSNGFIIIIGIIFAVVGAASVMFGIRDMIKHIRNK